jgi:hypothetical protein
LRNLGPTEGFEGLRQLRQRRPLEVRDHLGEFGVRRPVERREFLREVRVADRVREVLGSPAPVDPADGLVDRAADLAADHVAADPAGKEAGPATNDAAHGGAGPGNHGSDGRPGSGTGLRPAECSQTPTNEPARGP